MKQRDHGDGPDQRALERASSQAVGFIVASWLLYFPTIPLSDRSNRLGLCADLPGWMLTGVWLSGLLVGGGLLLRWLRLEAGQAGQGHLIAWGKDKVGGWFALILGLALGLLPWTMALVLTARAANMMLDQSKPQAEVLPAQSTVSRRKGGPICRVAFEARGGHFSAPVSCGVRTRMTVRALVHPGALGIPWVERSWSAE